MAYDADGFGKPSGVNVAECLRVADLVERSETFDMSVWGHSCGTPACIAGHMVDARTLRHALDLTDFTVSGDDAAIAYMVKKGAAILGISREKTLELFVPWKFHPLPSHHITNAHAAACLRKLAATGEVDWAGTKPTTGA